MNKKLKLNKKRTGIISTLFSLLTDETTVNINNDIHIVDYINKRLKETYVVGVILDEDGINIVNQYTEGHKLKIKYNGVCGSIANLIGPLRVSIKSNLGDFTIIVDDFIFAGNPIDKEKINIINNRPYKVLFNKELVNLLN